MSRKSKEEVIEAIRFLAKSTGTNVLTQKEFCTKSDVTIRNLLRYFVNWSDACQAAGVQHDTSHDRIPDEKLLIDWGLVTRNLGHPPGLNEYKLRGTYSCNAFSRFGKWIGMPDVFSQSFNGTDEWEDLLAILGQHSAKLKTKKTVLKHTTNNQSERRHWHEKLDSRPIYGDPIDFRGLRHEPVNEQGVVFLFGMVAKDLEYSVEAIQSGFPDCEAKRKIGRGQWQPVRIEFEYLSRNFEEHGHDPNKCDVIVCWIHNWEECPDEIEVLALSEVIKKLPQHI